MGSGISKNSPRSKNRRPLLGVGAAMLLAALFAACSVKMQASAGTNDDPEPPATGAEPNAAAPPTTATPPATTATAPAATTDPEANTTTPTPAATESAPPPTDPPADMPEVRRKGANLVMPGMLVFESGQASLTSDVKNEHILLRLQQFLKQNPNVTQIRVEGHTDNTGDAQANLELSGKRALAVKSWLLDKGVKSDRVLAVGFGGTKPIADNSTPDGQAQNRRTEFRVATIKGKKYLGMDPLGGGTEFK